MADQLAYHEITYHELLAQAPFGWRIRRCGELIQAGDLQPSGPVWEPIDKDRIGDRVDGCCYRPDGSPDFVMGQRKRKKPVLKKKHYEC